MCPSQGLGQDNNGRYHQVREIGRGGGNEGGGGGHSQGVVQSGKLTFHEMMTSWGVQDVVLVVVRISLWRLGYQCVPTCTTTK